MASSSDSDDESFVELGKPLPFVEGEGRKRPIILQDASSTRPPDVDFRGRPRFHGAFTGGFSAGYFNTVGSKEGWAPSTFVSSRKNKTEINEQKPEDFMDEEDLGEHGIAPRVYATADSFTSEERSSKRAAEALAATRDSVLPVSRVLTDLIVPEKLPIGIKLLRKMGWKEGQGVGPRVKKKHKKKKVSKTETDTTVKVYGCVRPPAYDGEEISSSEEIDLKNVTFAPKDVTPVSLAVKDNVHGLGYRGLDPRSALPVTHTALYDQSAFMPTKGKRGIRGQAFGVGALENDDEDIYAADSMSNYDQTMEIDDSEQLFGWTAPGAHKKKGKQAGDTQLPVTYVGKLLEGFTLSAKPLLPKKVFPPPVLPPRFQPFHRFKKTAEQLAQEALGEKPTAAPQKLNALERGLLLDEIPIATSVFDLIPKDDIRKMEAVKEAAKMAASRFQSAGTIPGSDRSVPAAPALKDQGQPEPFLASGPPPSAAVASASHPAQAEQTDSTFAPQFSGSAATFKPFRKDSAKQDRYDRYLALLRRGFKDPYETVATPLMTEWEKHREKEEFAKASKMYAPLSTMMASRFTRGGLIDDLQSSTLEVVEKSEEAKAAEMKMYGKLTRVELEWHPHNLLCKRFNVPNPYPESDIVGVPGLKRDKFSVFTFLSVPPSPQSTASSAQHSGAEKAQKKDTSDTALSLTRELNASKRRKGALSIFSVLEEKEEDKKTVTPLQKTGPSSTINAAADKEADDNAKNTQKETSEIEKDDKSDDEKAFGGQAFDLFRAVFKNSDSSSSDDDDDTAKKVVDKDDSSAESEKKKSESSDNEDAAQNSPSSTSKIQNDKLSEPSVMENKQPELNELSQETISTNSLNKLSSQPVDGPTITQPMPKPFPRRLKTSRWGQGSIFDVLDQSPPRTATSQEESQRADAMERLSPTAMPRDGVDKEEYGPTLPPPRSVSVTAAGPSLTPPASFSFAGCVIPNKDHKHKHQHKDRKSSSHKHKKKKSKHKKEKKKEKNKRTKHSERKKLSKSTSGSDADSETDSG